MHRGFLVMVISIFAVGCGKKETVERPPPSAASAPSIDSQLVIPSSKTGTGDMSDGLYQERAIALCKALSSRKVPDYSFHAADMQFVNDHTVRLFMAGSNFGDKVGCACEISTGRTRDYPGVKLVSGPICANG